jgi:hypothetical protein
MVGSAHQPKRCKDDSPNEKSDVHIVFLSGALDEG